MRGAAVLLCLVGCGRVGFGFDGVADAPTSDPITLSSLTVSALTPTGFTAAVDFAGDVGARAAVTLAYCDETADRSCDPTAGASIAMVRGASSYTASPSGLTYGDTYALTVTATDDGGVVGSPLTAYSQPADPYFANVVLLTHLDGAAGSTQFTDRTGNVMTTIGSAQVTTTLSVFGGASAAFDGTTAYLSMPYATEWNVGSGAFTFEGWFRVLTEAGGCSSGSVFTQGPDLGPASSYWFGFCGDGGDVTGYAEKDGNGWQYESVAGGPSLMNDGQWHHVAWVRQPSSNLILGYLDGSLNVATTLPLATTALYTSTLPFLIGAQSNPQTYFHGYMDELRVTAGIARYTGTFTPPTMTFTDY